MKPPSRNLIATMTLVSVSLFTASAVQATTGQLHDNWLDESRTPGDWSYRQDVSQSHAQYVGAGGQLFSISCNFSGPYIQLERPVANAQPGMMRIRTETDERIFSVTPISGTNTLSITLKPNDQLLDAMAVTKGRFAVELEGAPTLYLPSWAEVTRVVEDCR